MVEFTIHLKKNHKADKDHLIKALLHHLHQALLLQLMSVMFLKKLSQTF
jgi:hypothetical protein